MDFNMYFYNMQEGYLTLNDSNLGSLPLITWNKAYRRDFLIKHNLDWREKIIYEDVEFYWKTVTKTRQVYLLDKHLYYYRQRAGSIMQSSVNNIEKSKNTRITNNNGKWHANDFGNKVKITKINNGHTANWTNIEKAKNTKLEKYGDINFNNKEKNKLTRKTNFYKKLLTNKEIIPMFSLNEYLNENKNYTFKWKCLKCGTEFFQKFNYNFKCNQHIQNNVRCLTCFPYKTNKISNEETILFNFIKSISLDATQSNRLIIHPLELDIYIPSKKLAIEFDGLYWHNDENKSNNYHLDKTKICLEKGIQLIHIFEDEWIYKQNIVKSRLKNLLGVYDKTIFARKCEIKEVNNKTSKEFQEENHIQGSVNSKVSLGLYFNNKLISLMTFGKCRFDKKHEWELLRFCNKLGYHIPGSASKLLKYFERNYQPKSLVSYADRRWSQGKVYEKLGFIKLFNSKPNYFYINQNIRESRIKYQKHKLKNLLENFDPTKTEVENMKANGYNRIFDCGNMVFEKIY
jgi:hypothetical protein